MVPFKPRWSCRTVSPRPCEALVDRHLLWDASPLFFNSFELRTLWKTRKIILIIFIYTSRLQVISCNGTNSKHYCLINFLISAIFINSVSRMCLLVWLLIYNCEYVLLLGHWQFFVHLPTVSCPLVLTHPLTFKCGKVVSLGGQLLPQSRKRGAAFTSGVCTSVRRKQIIH